MSTIKVINETFTLDALEQGKLLVKKWKPVSAGEVVGELSVKLYSNRPNHCILLASRFNERSVEPNAPFPGWFLQIVGTTFSFAWGDGRKWNSVRTAPVENNKEYHIVFKLDNKTKRAEIYLNGELSFKDNITFKPPCDTLTVGGLSPAGNTQFRFVGEMKNLKLGGSIKMVESVPEDNSGQPDISRCVEQLKTLGSNVANIKNDIASLESVMNQIESWKLRGIQIDTQLLENQIAYLTGELAAFNSDFTNDYNKLKALDDQIRVEPKSGESNQDSVLDKYEHVLQNLLGDVKILNNAVKDLSQYKEIGVKLGDAFSSIDEQKEAIKKILLQCEGVLQQYIDATDKIMNNVV